jgi:methionyl-tRNA synthetase
LPADIFARYHRTKGNEVLMVSGSDQHGTPITVRAEQEGKKPSDIAGKYHQEFLESWQKLGISFDLYTSTGTANHAEVTHDIFLTLLKQGDIYKSRMSQLYCPKCQRFLPDRYVEGTCPYCGSPGARGDQCDRCGKPLNATELINPRCRVCGTLPQIRESEHFFLKLTAFQDRLLGWVKQQTHWRQNVLNFTLSYLEEGLKDRAITRDIDWGVPVPVAGFDNKRIYVWFEAVIGYLSASKEWAKSSGNGEKWRAFWQGDTKSYYFIGKDNIVFHTIIWPAMLMGYDELNLPYDVPANEFLTIAGQKLSTSRNWAVWVPDYLSRYDPDPLRYFLSINMPETSDSDFSWREFIRRNNDELVATYGNLVHRVLTFVNRNFNGAVPAVGELDGQSRALLDQAEDTLKTVDGLLYRCRFREAIRAAMSLAQESNRYLDDKSPWKAIKPNRAAAGTSLYTAIGVISDLKTMLYPFLPFSSQKLHEYLGFKGRVEECGWQRKLPQPGQKLPSPQPLFTKLDEKLVDEETSRLGQASN